jgi:hypothetical protein
MGGYVQSHTSDWVHQGGKVMIKFDMSVTDNFASFYDSSSDGVVFVDTFDNHEFNVRVGTLEATQLAGVVVASTDEELNSKLERLVQRQ